MAATVAELARAAKKPNTPEDQPGCAVYTLGDEKAQREPSGGDIVTRNTDTGPLAVGGASVVHPRGGQ